MKGTPGMDINGKTVVVTGGAGGIGRASALAFAGQRAGLIHIVDVDQAGMAETARQVAALSPSTQVHSAAVDLSDLDAVQQWLTAIEAEGGYDILHNNAGAVMASQYAFPQTPVDRLRWIMQLNLMSVIVTTQQAAHHMHKRGGGVIVNTSSIVALEGSPDALYSTTKAAVLMFTRSCASLQDGMNVRVAGILPGNVDTPALRKACAEVGYTDWLEGEVANGMVASPENIADVVIELVQNDALPGGSCILAQREKGDMTRTLIEAF